MIAKPSPLEILMTEFLPAAEAAAVEAQVATIQEPPGVTALGDLRAPVYGNDPSELLKHRYMYRGAVCLLCGPTGVGKSALLMQAASYWAVGKAFFGILPGEVFQKAGMRILLVQAENDEGDLAEMRDGVLVGCDDLTDEEKALPDVPAARLIGEIVGVSHTFDSSQLATVAGWRDATARTGADGKRRELPPLPTRRPAADKAHAVKMAYEYRVELGLPDVPSAGLISQIDGLSDHCVTDQLRTVRSWVEAAARIGADGKTRELPPLPTRRPAADKAHAVKMAYVHQAELGLPDVPAANLIAEIVGFSDIFVTNQLLSVGSWSQAPARTGGDGKTRNLPPVPVRRAAPKAGERTNGTQGTDGAVEACRPHGWIMVDEDGVSFPNYDRHNGQCAKKRLAEAQRVRRWREQQKVKRSV